MNSSSRSQPCGAPNSAATEAEPSAAKRFCAWLAGVCGASFNAILFYVAAQGIASGRYHGWEPWALAGSAACAFWACCRYGVAATRTPPRVIPWRDFEATVLDNVPGEDREAVRYALDLAVTTHVFGGQG